MAAPISAFNGVLARVCIPTAEEPPYTIETGLCQQLASDDLANRSLGLSCLEEGRLQNENFATEDYAMSIVHYGEVRAIQVWIELAEAGELH